MQRMLREKKPANWPCEIVILNLFGFGKNGIPLDLCDPVMRNSRPSGESWGIASWMLDPAIDPIIHLGLGDFKRHAACFLPVSRRDSDDDHLTVAQRVGADDVRLGSEGFRDVRHVSNYSYSVAVSTRESVISRIDVSVCQ